MLLWSGNREKSHDIVWPAGEMTGSAFGEMEDFSMKKTIYANTEPISDREAIQRLALAAKAGEQAAKEEVGIRQLPADGIHIIFKAYTPAL